MDHGVSPPPIESVNLAFRSTVYGWQYAQSIRPENLIGLVSVRTAHTFYYIITLKYENSTAFIFQNEF